MSLELIALHSLSGGRGYHNHNHNHNNNEKRNVELVGSRLFAPFLGCAA
jgi:hypothetical protein